VATQIAFAWRGDFETDEVNRLHAEAFDTRLFDAGEWNWKDLVRRHSLGWVVARDGSELVGFVNVLWDGLVHAWLQDTMVANGSQHKGVATRLVAIAHERARRAGCEWLHVDCDDNLRPFYIDVCGFVPTNAGLIALNRELDK
jgi:GNAT superfamily N-acetyltransferase